MRNVILVLSLIVVSSAQPFVSFTSFQNECDSTVNNQVDNLYLYPADGSCFVPAGGEELITGYGYIITFDQTNVTVTQFDDTNCTSSNSITNIYLIDTCVSGQDFIVSTWETLPDDQYWVNLGIVGVDGQWQTVLITNYYSDTSCQNNTLVSVQVQGWPECYNGYLYYCQNDEIAYEGCVDTSSCASGCVQSYEPLDNACTPSDKAPVYWSSYLDYTTSASYQATCAGGILPSPSPSPSPAMASPSPNPTPSASPTPMVSVPFVSFTTYNKTGCNATSGNFVNDLYLYPADGSCFSPAGGSQFNTSYGYTITYNATVVTVNQYASQDCFSLSSIQTYPIGSCSSQDNCVVSVWPVLPPDQYWASQGLYGEGNTPWEVVLVTTYYSQVGCAESSLTSIQVYGFDACFAGFSVYCVNGDIHDDYCSNAAQCSDCTPIVAPLDDACTDSVSAPSFWSAFLDTTTSASYQSTCAQGTSPSPTPSPTASPSSLVTSPSSSPGFAGPFASFTTYGYSGCNSTLGNYVESLYLYPADGSCFVPAGGTGFYINAGYRITVNQNVVTIQEYTNLDCSSAPFIYSYQTDVCQMYLVVSVYQTLPDDEYWVNQGLMGFSDQPWQTILVVNYFSDNGCSDSSLISVEVEGWKSCDFGEFFYCQNGEIHFDSCENYDCDSGCVEYYAPLDNTCTISANASGYWNVYLDTTTSVSYIATCVGTTNDSSSLVISASVTVLSLLSVIF